MTLIMVVDDDPDILGLTTTALQIGGHDTMAYNNAHDVVAALNDQQPDLLITDFHMPAMTGGELAQHIRRNPRTAHNPIIMVTGGANPSQVGDGLIDMFMTKPFSPRNLRERVTLLLRRSDPPRLAHRGPSR